MEIESIKYDLYTQFHMLRHFERVDENLRLELSLIGYSLEMVNKEFTQIGSRFSNKFATDIESLLKQMELYGYQETKGLNGNLILVCTTPNADYVDGIGAMAVVPIKALSPKQQAEIIYKENRNVPLAHLQVESLPLTNTFCIVLKKKSGAYLFITAFPGEPAMPLPDERMDNYIYNQAKAYWDAHVFLFT